MNWKTKPLINTITKQNTTRMLISPIFILISKRNIFNFHKTGFFEFRVTLNSFKCGYASNISKKISQNTVSGTLHDRTAESTGKSKIISELNFQLESHAAPFYKLPIKTLLQIYKTTKNDQENGFCPNRLYFIASHIKCPPSMLSERLARRSFIYNLSFDWLENSLKVLLEKGVSGDRILRDLWVLKYHHKTIEERLQKIKDLGIDTLYPWMVRCSEDILDRYINIYQETKTILGNDKSTKVYIAKRLNTKLDIVEEMYTKVPTLERIRVSKVKHFLDFLFEEGFTIEEIISKPRVLSASQKTVKGRLEKLRNLGLKNINLNVLCRSRKDFKKYYESLQSASKTEKQL